MKERDEQIAEKARKLAILYTKDYDDEGKEVYNIGTEVACLEMAEWIDEHPRKGLVDIDKACEWLLDNVYGYIEESNNPKFSGGYTFDFNSFLNDFRKAMEE